MSDAPQVPVLLVHAGPGAGRVLPLMGERLVLGRDPACALPFDAPGVSREHCEFTHDEAGWSVRDLGARNGTRLNSRPLADEAVILSEGDRLLCGTLELEFALDRGATDRLRIVQGPLAGRAIPLRSAVAIIGRSAPDADLSLNDHAASRHNTELRFEDGIWTVRDLESRNGTDYDGARLPPNCAVRLHSGARLRIGASTCDFLDRRIEDLANHLVCGYSLEERVAAGPGAVVYRGRGADGSVVALKILDPGRAQDAVATARFITGGRAQARWQHPHMVPALSAERADEHVVAIAHWISGGCLSTRLGGNQALPLPLVLDWALDIANGLQAGADQNQPHRGLRPGNCLLAGDGRIVVADTATATAYDHHQPHGPVPPHYLAPEELDGSDPTPISNQFSLGCILYHALSGRAPFGAPDRAKVAEARRDQTLPALESVGSDANKVLSRLLGRAVQDRYPTWAEVIADLEALRQGVSPQTGLLPTGHSALGSGGSVRTQPAAGLSSTRRVSQREDTGTDTVARRPQRAPEAVVIHPWAMRGAILFILGLIVVGFVLPALNNHNRSSEQATPIAAPVRPAAPPVTTPVASPSLAPPRTPTQPPQGIPPARSAASPPTAAATTPAITPEVVGAPPVAPALGNQRTSAPIHAGPNAALPSPIVDNTSPPETRPAPAPAPTIITGAQPNFATTPAPALNPIFVTVGRIGGPGAQYIREVGFEGTTAWGRGDGFTVRIDCTTGRATVEGTPVDDRAEWDVKYRTSPKDTVTLADPRNGQTYSITTQQVHPILQQPLLTSTAGWKMWGWNYDDVAEGTKNVRWGPLMADSCGYDVWLMPQGRIGVLCWTDGSNSVLTRDPRDLSLANAAVENGGERSSAGGMATLFLVVDPEQGTPVSGTFIRSHVTARAVDAWGRVYLPRALDEAKPLIPSTPDAGAGLAILDSDLRRTVLNLRIGAGTANGDEAFGVLAVHERWAILGGTTAAELPALGGGGKRADGDGQDAFLCVVKLW